MALPEILLEHERKVCAPAPRSRACSSLALFGVYAWSILLVFRRAVVMRWWFRLRWVTYAGGALSSLVLIATVLLWWRLGSGPIEFDVATPSAALSQIGANRRAGTANLTGQTVGFFAGESRSRAVNLQGELVSLVPHFQLSKVFHRSSPSGLKKRASPES